MPNKVVFGTATRKRSYRCNRESLSLHTHTCLTLYIVSSTRWPLLFKSSRDGFDFNRGKMPLRHQSLRPRNTQMPYFNSEVSRSNERNFFFFFCPGERVDLSPFCVRCLSSKRGGGIYRSRTFCPSAGRSETPRALKASYIGWSGEREREDRSGQTLGPKSPFISGDVVPNGPRELSLSLSL